MPVLVWWLLLEALGVLALPLLFPLFSRANAHGYPFAKIAGLLLITWIAWLLGFVIPYATAFAIAVGAVAVLAAAAAVRQRAALGAWLADGGWTQIVRADGLWTVGFLFFVAQRWMAPDIFGAEKYMDFAFINALLRAPSMPPYDPWMSGDTINYYYFGYLMFANLMRVAPVAETISYNLCVATVGGLAFAQTAWVVFALTARWGLGLLGGAMSAVLGNLDGAWQFLEKGTLRGMDYWRSSRVVAKGDTINEFPFFSTIHGDLHPHFMVLPVAILLLAALLDERLFPSRAADPPMRPWPDVRAWAVVSALLAAMVAISNWELPMGVLAVALLAGRAIPLTPLLSRQRLWLGVALIGTLVAVYVLFLPFYRQFVPPLVKPGPNDPCIGSACFTIARTSLREFLTVFGLLLFPPAVLVAVRGFRLLPTGGGEGGHLMYALAAAAIALAAIAGNAVLPLLVVLLLGALAIAYRDSEGPERAGFLLIALGLIALLACEVAFLKDSYGDRLYRMNTVFKLYFQAWTILAIAAPWALGQLLAREWSWTPMPRVLTAATALLVAMSTCYPLGITLDRMGSPWKTLDGNAYLRREHPGDFAAIEWLREHVDAPTVVLEATGNPYSYFARFSANTGLPTVLGWANHEGLWRGHDRAVFARRDDIARIYNGTTLAEVAPLLARYDVRYIAVGDLEREQHAAGLAKFRSLPVAFQGDGTVIYRYAP